MKPSLDSFQFLFCKQDGFSMLLDVLQHKIIFDSIPVSIQHLLRSWTCFILNGQKYNIIKMGIQITLWSITYDWPSKMKQPLASIPGDSCSFSETIRIWNILFSIHNWTMYCSPPTVKMWRLFEPNVNSSSWIITREWELESESYSYVSLSIWASG